MIVITGYSQTIGNVTRYSDYYMEGYQNVVFPFHTLTN